MIGKSRWSALFALGMLLAVGCAEAEKLLEDAKKSAEQATATAVPSDTPPAAATTPTPTPLATSSPAIGESVPAPPVTPAPLSDDVLLAEWAKLPTNARGDSAILRLASASEEARATITEINVYGVDLSLTAAGLDALSQFPQLTNLNVSQHALDESQMAAIGRLQGLEVLAMSNCQLTDSLLQPLENLSSLRSLTLEQNSGVHDAGLLAIHRHTTLETLRIANTLIEGTSLLKAKYLASLKHFEGDRTQLGEAAFVALAGAKNLEHLGLTATHANDRRMKSLGRHTKLRTVLLGENMEVTDLGISALHGNPQLEVLDLRETAVSNKGVAFLKTAKHLRQLNTQGTRVDDAARAALQKLLPECEIK